ncbi:MULTISPECIES: ABC transporter ATP-binding protein [Anoxynatronum]|uniref:Nickel import system ATP-binding protein NikD n=2 Tax=Anoxynatronum TaxID=210622 RepID=A0AA45WVX3_9CLOT|nr:ABC transporter ATP-binding protein [Anoxynatronum buryatiense]SMP51078.1 peptide/nickel transport system ATP-binding protein [Anoxynatronum buryatiense]
MTASSHFHTKEPIQPVMTPEAATDAHGEAATDPPHLTLDALAVDFHLATGPVRAVNGASLTFHHGTIHGIVGESGCGKSVLGLSLLGLLPPYAAVTGRIHYRGQNLLQCRERDFRRLRGRSIGLIPQSPQDSLNPVVPLGRQLLDALWHHALPRSEKQSLLCRLLNQLGFSSPASLMQAYAFQLSGGMQQRVLAAMGVAADPAWILADEPTKGLDQISKEQTVQLLKTVTAQSRRGLIVITHDLPMAAALCDQVSVMYAGEMLETGPHTLTTPCHPYTRGLLASLPEKGFQPMAGKPPALGTRFTGCAFSSRCPAAMARCQTQKPPESRPKDAPRQKVRCFLYA